MPVWYYGVEGADAKERFRFWQQNRPSAISIDVETVSLDERHPLGFGIALSPQEAFYFDLQPEPPRELELVKEWLSDIRIVKIAHNWMFDMGVFPLIPIVGNYLNRANIWDTNVAARLLGRIETALSILCSEVNMSTVSALEILRKHGCKDMMQLWQKDPMLVADHCQADAKASYRLYLEWKDKIHSQYPEYFKVEMQVIPILLDLSMRGIIIDQQARAELAAKYGAEVDFYEKLIQAQGIANPGSPQQVGYTLASRGTFLKMTRSKRQLSTRKAELEFIEDPLASAILSFRHNSKFKSTYLDPLEGQDRFYTEYYLDTVVGRLNSRNRNIQNIPEDARYMFLPDNGIFTTGDYSREHLYILAHMSQDPDMLEILYDPDPDKRDMHRHTAHRMSVPRPLARTLNYAVVYGATEQTVSEQSKIRDLEKCKRLIDYWFKTFPVAAGWIFATQAEGLRTGWATPTVFGRRIKIPDNEPEVKRKAKAVNYPILGSDGEIIKRAIILCNNRGLGPPTMAITVHDSITWDGDVQSRLPVEELEIIPGFRIPFEVKQTFRWE